MSEKYGLSNKAITEEYEDLIFRKVMARYAENQSEKIEEEIAAENAAADKNVLRKLFGKKERRENAATLWKYGKKLITAAAMVVFVGVVSVSSVVVASAEAREAIAEYLYSLVIKDMGTHVSVTEGSSEKITRQRYILSYVPNGFQLKETLSYGIDGRLETYSNGEIIFSFEEDAKSAWIVPNPEKENDPEKDEFLGAAIIGEKQYYYRTYGDGQMDVFWLEGDATLTIIGPEEMRGILFDIAEGVVLNEKYEGERTPVEIIEIQEEKLPIEKIEQEKYDWEGAWMPTYIPAGFHVSGSAGSSDCNSVEYSNGDDFIVIDQRGKNYFISAGEEVPLNIDGHYGNYDELFNATWVVDNTIITIISSVDEVWNIAEGLVPSEYIVERHYEGTYFVPRYIPDGFEYVEEIDMSTTTCDAYIKDDLYFRLIQADGYVTSWTPSEYVEQKTMTIYGNEAVYTKMSEETEKEVQIIWFAEEGYFEVWSNLPDEEIFKIIDSLAPVEQE